MNDCPMCLTPDAPALGQLGRLVWFRCAACGWTFSLQAEETCDD